MKKIAITGAAGVVGSGLRQQLLQRGYLLLLLDVLPITDCAAGETAAVADITDKTALLAQLRGVDALVHLAACTSDAAWPDQVRLSVEGCITVFDAAREAGVNRIVYASSHHVVGMHPRPPAGLPVDGQVQLRPDSRYAVGKAFGESLAALYACKFGMQVLAIRIGNANSEPVDRRRLGNWISWRDLGQLVAIGLEHPDLVFEVVYGVSDTTGRHYDNSAAYALGYQPDDGTAAAGFEAGVLRQDPAPAAGSALADSAGELSLGGFFSQSEYVGSTARLRARG
jgi:uronate dehydrogenase